MRSVRHPLIGEVAYNAGSLPTERRRLHSSIAVAAAPTAIRPHDATPPANSPSTSPVPATNRAPSPLFDAAATPQSGSRPAARLVYLERILDLWIDALDRSTTTSWSLRLWQAADLMSASGRNDLAVELAGRAIAEHAAGRPCAVVGDVLFGPAGQYERLARFLWSSARWPRAPIPMPAALLEAAGDGSDAGAALTYGGLAELEPTLSTSTQRLGQPGVGGRGAGRRSGSVRGAAGARRRRDARRPGPCRTRHLPSGRRRQLSRRTAGPLPTRCWP